MTRIGIPEQQEFQGLTIEEHGAFIEALDAARDAVPPIGTIPLEAFLAKVSEVTGGGDMLARHALSHLQAKGEALHRYGVGVSRPEWRRAA
ncbi:hypothetical protein ACWGJ9_11765 [Curtobacterium citreum]